MSLRHPVVYTNGKYVHKYMYVYIHIQGIQNIIHMKGIQNIMQDVEKMSKEPYVYMYM